MTGPTEDVVDYVPTTYPGARLPHAVVSVDGAPVSVHEALDPKKLSLFTFAGDLWAEAVSQLEDAGPGLSLIAAQVPAGADRAELIRLYEVGETGAVLVRPDGHTAWRTSASGEDAARELSEFVHRQWGRYFAVSSAAGSIAACTPTP